MDRESYPFIYDSDTLEYEFDSVGTKGTIRKIVKFHFVQKTDGEYYEMTFGDKPGPGRKIDDLHISNNGDLKRIMITLTEIILDFTKRERDPMIVMAGSTPARCRLYRIQISTNLSIIQQKLYVMGVRYGKVELFKADVNYDAFFVARKRDYKFEI